MSYIGIPGELALANTRNDASLIRRTMTSLGFASVDWIQDADDTDFRRQFNAFLARFRPGELAVIYAAAHGVQIGAENHLLLNDGKTFLSLTSLLDAVRSTTETLIFLLDACRNNPFEELPTGAAGVRAIAPMPAPGPTQAGQLGFVFKPLAKDVAVARVGAFMIKGTGVRVVFATDPNNVAYDYAQVTDVNSPFAAAMAVRLQEKRSLDDAIAMATGDVVKRTQGDQSPWSQGSIGRPIYLAGPPKQRNPAKPPFQVPG